MSLTESAHESNSSSSFRNCRRLLIKVALAFNETVDVAGVNNPWRKKKKMATYFERFALQVGGDSGADAIANPSNCAALVAPDGGALFHAQNVLEADKTQILRALRLGRQAAHVRHGNDVLSKVESMQVEIQRCRALVGRNDVDLNAGGGALVVVVGVAQFDLLHRFAQLIGHRQLALFLLLTARLEPDLLEKAAGQLLFAAAALGFGDVFSGWRRRRQELFAGRQRIGADIRLRVVCKFTCKTQSITGG